MQTLFIMTRLAFVEEGMKNYIRPEGSLISYFSNKVKASGGINLAQGMPGFKPPQELLAILAEIVNEDVHQYSPGTGDMRLKAMLKAKYAEKRAMSDDEILITNGATEAISLIYTYLEKVVPKPFSALAFEPVYESYSHLPEIFGNRFVSFPISRQNTIDFERLAKVVAENRVKVFFVASPGNPQGRIWKEQEIRALHSLARDFDAYVVFDGVYQDLYFNEPPFVPVDALDKHLLYVNSFSKMLYITGWRLGYMIADRQHLQKITPIHDYTGLSSPSVLQRAVAIYLERNNLGRGYLTELRHLCQRSFEHLESTLAHLGFRIPPVEGGYFVWAALPEGFYDSFLFAEELYDETQVAVVPGIHFSAEAGRFVRFNAARPIEEIREAAERITRFIHANR